MTTSPLLDIRGLRVSSEHSVLVDGIDLQLSPGERVGIIGESGSGKTLTALSALGLPPEGLVQEGSVRLAGQELVGAPDRIRRRLRGTTVSMVFQEPLTALDPLMRIDKQLGFAARSHGTSVADLLADVALPKEAGAKYPHELSGGQRQRVLIAMAMAGRPDVLICDEPTTALDADTQAGVLNVIYDLANRHGTALLFVTHDLSVAAAMCETLVVMQAGRIVERGPAEQVLQRPQHDYTKALVAASRPRLSPVENTSTGGPETPAAITVDHVSKSFGPHAALRDVSLTVTPGERLGLVGGSGSGKTTLLSIIAGLREPDAGSVTANGRIQMVFQDPHGSLDPRMRVGEIVAEGLTGTSHHRGSGLDAQERKHRVAEVLREVGLDAAAADRFPHEFSGGQRQRISIARAIIGDPDILLADEAVSALDVSVRGKVLALLGRLVQEHRLTLLFISHDLGVVRQLCDRIAVIHDGTLLEVGPTEQVWDSPQSEYTRRLIAAAREVR